MICCYIIHSVKLDRYYTGVCQEDLTARIEKHNNHSYGNKSFTAKASDWELYLQIEVDSFDHAVRIERKIKSQKSSKFLENLKRYPELLEKVVLEQLNG